MFNIEKLQPYTFQNDLIISISRKYNAINRISISKEESEKSNYFY